MKSEARKYYPLRTSVELVCDQPGLLLPKICELTTVRMRLRDLTPRSSCKIHQHTWLGVQAICRNFVNQLLITLKKANTATFKECLIVKLEKMKEVPSEFLNLGTSFGCSFKNND
ncbi:hypothetical protein VP01_2614g3 [Puccinia sorghi]|uniref:Uncharacterized protein n=1 Tax=Puccinia sorghi TaxID=27349 RepID=A0A0L6V4G4_9BASI|nr:hypothetical protein VP01_2614g3 [Puccinia sorghi]